MNSTVSSIGEGLMILVGLSIPVLIVAIWFRNRARKKAYALSDEGFEAAHGSEADLRRAEEVVRGTLEEIRENLLRDHELVERLSTNQGFTTEYVDQLVSELRAKGIGCQSYFQETMPMGVGMAIVDPVGVFELYVKREQVAEATKFMRDRVIS